MINLTEEDDVVTVNMKRSTVEYLQKMAELIRTQDNLGTRSPYFYTIKNYRKVPTAEGYSDYFEFVSEDNETSYTIESLRVEIPDMELSEDEHADKETKQQILKLLDQSRYEEVAEILDFKIVYMMEVEEDHNVFFTAEAAQKFLKINHYHYSPKAHTYLDYAWRNPEIEVVLDAIMQISGITQ